MNSGKVLADPAWIPHALDGDRVVLVRVTPASVRGAAFLDGRERFDTDRCTVPSAEFIAAHLSWPTRPLPAIVHVSFCGSTLLARLLERPNTLVYREPAIQIELADRLAAGQSVEALVLAATSALARPVGPMKAVVKPSNWANGLLPLWVKHRAIEPIFVTMSASSFLTAVFRGGRERIAFTMRVAQHLAHWVPGGSELVQTAVRSQSDPLRQAAALTLVALSVQCRLMADARARLKLGSDSIIDASEILADPAAAAGRAALCLEVDRPDLDLSTSQHAKGGGIFSRDDETSRNRGIERLHQSTFGSALKWADSQGLCFTV